MASAVWSVGALWVTVCDCPPPLPVWVSVLLWLVLLTFCAVALAAFALVCVEP
ncbi:MAG: hypothetical protein WCF27_01780 [Gaiellaceae bacterium]